MPPSSDAPDLSVLTERRADDCRMVPERALATLDDAAMFLAERAMLTLTPDCALPSLFGACHEEPYMPGKRGFGSWPKTKWWWGFALTERPGVHALRIHRGKRLYVTLGVIRLLDPLCRDELERAEQGELGAAARDLVAFLAAAGPTALDDVKRELGMSSAALRQTRDRLERVGAVVSRTMVQPAQAHAGEEAGERESSELARWDQRFPDVSAVTGILPGQPGGLDGLLVMGVRAAVVAPEAELRQWFSWPLPGGMVDELVEQGHLWRPATGWIAAERA
jgi:hypothetical protein